MHRGAEGTHGGGRHSSPRAVPAARYDAALPHAPPLIPCHGASRQPHHSKAPPGVRGPPTVGLPSRSHQRDALPSRSHQRDGDVPTPTPRGLLGAHPAPDGVGCAHVLPSRRHGEQGHGEQGCLVGTARGAAACCPAACCLLAIDQPCSRLHSNPNLLLSRQLSTASCLEGGPAADLFADARHVALWDRACNRQSPRRAHVRRSRNDPTPILQPHAP